MSKKLTKKQKAYNKKTYALIRKYWKEAQSRSLYNYSLTGDEDYLATSKITYKQFKNRVLDYYNGKNRTGKRLETSIREAAKKMINTEDILSPAARSRLNFIESLKEKFPGDYNYLRRMSRDAKGHWLSLRDNLEWSNKLNGYVLGGKYFIDITNSPEEIRIIEIN